MNPCVALGALLLAGCSSFATMQEAETVPERRLQLGFGGSLNSYVLQDEVAGSTTAPDGSPQRVTRTERFTLPALLFWGRYGIGPRTELHGMVWVPFGASVGGKLMVLGERGETGFVLSPGLDVSLPVEVTVDDERSLLFDVIVPLHLGYRFGDGVASYLTPKYVLRVHGGELAHTPGGTLGLALGSGLRLLLEGGLYLDTLTEETVTTASVGLQFE